MAQGEVWRGYSVRRVSLDCWIRSYLMTGVIQSALTVSETSMYGEINDVVSIFKQLPRRWPILKSPPEWMPAPVPMITSVSRLYTASVVQSEWDGCEITVISDDSFTAHLAFAARQVSRDTLPLSSDIQRRRYGESDAPNATRSCRILWRSSQAQ